MIPLPPEAANVPVFFSKKIPVLFFPVREVGSYKVGRQWGIFDTIGVRGIDDLIFDQGLTERTVFAFTKEPPHGSDTRVVTLPAQIALERVFSHIQGISKIVINPQSVVSGCARQQQELEFSVVKENKEEWVIDHKTLPEFIGAYSLPRKKISDPLKRAERAFTNGSLFEAFYLARSARRAGISEVKRAWYIELMAMSFMGLAEEVLSLYEESPLRNSAEPLAQLLAGRLRILLNQPNEGRTILHALTFNEELKAVALCELARSYSSSSEFDKAIDAATNAIVQDPAYYESYLVRGIAQRGIAFAAGDEESSKDALKDLEQVAQQGGFSAPEALFHAGTIFGRLGALEQAEVALRQSLFLRDRYSSRDALIRVTCAAGKMSIAREELQVLVDLLPSATGELKKEVESHEPSVTADPSHKGSSSGQRIERDAEAADAAVLLSSWKIPIRSTVQDFTLLDDLINRYAPAGEFMSSGDFGHLHKTGEVEVGRAISLHLGSLLVKSGAARWDHQQSEKICLVSGSNLLLPLESFVHERILLGASGDNFSSLESLVSEISAAVREMASAAPIISDWWKTATSEEVKRFETESAWARGKLIELGADLRDSLGDLDEIDRIVELSFEPGGTIKEVALEVLGQDLERFVIGVGLLVGGLIARHVSATWYSHELPEGISLVARDLGRVFPVARVQRRMYLSGAADTSSKLGSFAFGVAAAVISERIRAGAYHDQHHVVTAFKELLPRLGGFLETELEGVANALLDRNRLG